MNDRDSPSDGSGSVLTVLSHNRKPILLALVALPLFTSPLTWWAAGPALVWLFIRWINNRDDPRRAKRQGQDAA
jgi:hypothetical protein